MADTFEMLLNRTNDSGAHLGFTNGTLSEAGVSRKGDQEALPVFALFT